MPICWMSLIAIVVFSAAPAAQEKEEDTAAQLALSIAAEHLDVSSGELNLVALEEVQWQDSSLGCPKPGRRYLPVIISGYKAVVDYSGRHYNVHIGRGKGLVCEGILRKGP